jgi:hypothetical protein
MTENITTCLNGELRPGDLVLSTPDDEYGLLVGTVLAVNKVGSPDHEMETENETDSVHVNFMALRYSDRRLLEIDMMLSELYGENRSLLAAPLDGAVMAPDALIRIDGIDAEDLNAILSSEEKAAACFEKVRTGLETAPAGRTAITEKLYSPLKFYLRDNNTALAGGYDENEYWRDELTHTEALRFMDNLELFLRRDREYYNTERGLMEYYHGPESVDDKVISLLPAIELREGRLWCVADIRLREPLTAEEMAALKDYWSGQLSDGVGESWEQEAVKVPGGELYMQPWTSDDSFFIDTEKEFRGRLAPDIANADREPDHAGARTARFVTSGEKLSVITQIHRARDEAKKDPIPQSSIPSKSHEPGL